MAYDQAASGGTAPVTSVAGRTGAIVLTSADVSGTASMLLARQQTQARNMDLSVVTGSFTMISGTVYFQYLGYTTTAVTFTDVELGVVSPGSGAQTAEMGLASTPTGPDGTAKTFTKIAAGGSLDALTAGGFKGFGSPISQAVAAGVHVWAMCRVAMASSQPAVMGLMADHGRGHIQTTTGQGALTGSSSWTGVVPTTFSSAAVGPDLRALLS